MREGKPTLPGRTQVDGWKSKVHRGMRGLHGGTPFIKQCELAKKALLSNARETMAQVSKIKPTRISDESLLHEVAPVNHISPAPHPLPGGCSETDPSALKGRQVITSGGLLVCTSFGLSLSSRNQLIRVR